jgi:hypothetical protein
MFRFPDGGCTAGFRAHVEANTATGQRRPRHRQFWKRRKLLDILPLLHRRGGTLHGNPTPRRLLGNDASWEKPHMEKASATLFWSASWSWGLPLILLAVLFHVSGLWLFTVFAGRLEHLQNRRGRSYSLFVLVLGLAVLLVTILHAIEAVAWAGAYVALGALPGYPMAILYSLNAMTTYGHDTGDLEVHWRLMGALEALNGMLLFGLTTAFLFAVAQRVWPLRRLEIEEPTHRNSK